MTDDRPTSQPSAPKPAAKSAARQARLSAALRENLLRRKEAARSQVSQAEPPSQGPARTKGEP